MLSRESVGISRNQSDSVGKMGKKDTRYLRLRKNKVKKMGEGQAELKK